TGESKGSQRAWEFGFRPSPHSETSADRGRSQQIVEDGLCRRTYGHAISRRPLSAVDVGGMMVRRGFGPDDAAARLLSDLGRAIREFHGGAATAHGCRADLLRTYIPALARCIGIVA